MAGPKEVYQLELNPEQMEFLKSAMEKHGIPDESKVVRIMVDYLISTPSVHATVFDRVRCLRCE